ncbi:hypothetical protein Bsp3421_002197 [Burkholderia sp. FERM BP-3421]|jgi:hypothetical protein|uniref:hypothetical protein n=1 Tax=Burkholderia sp. FERM BP-3421 TaxID=1494466 RepID=UPI002360BDDA|nr:hypothetical protein [Burkholderia sp. FERM BP-3421]WDD92209.1 hypothetical protein Bsp3421_002197 [Burkholderia sp. FERM BP-3421]
MKKHLLVALALGMCAFGRVYADAQLPSFDAYPVADGFKGRVAKVRIQSSKDREFATRLREVTHGKPNFAGHYILSSWGCGASCVTTVAVDAKTGQTTWLPFTLCCWAPEIDVPIEFRANSRLLILHGSRNETGSGTYYYQLGGSGFELVKAVEVGASQ